MKKLEKGDDEVAPKNPSTPKGPRVTVSFTTVVYVQVRGEPAKGIHRLPALPVDDGKVGQLLDWMHKEKLYNVIRGVGAQGPGMMDGAFDPEDQARIEAKCAELGIEVVSLWERP